MSKILLIKPRYLGLDLLTITQPMGLMYIGAALKRAGHDPKIHDCYHDRRDLHILRETITNWKPDFIGISIIVTELEQTKSIMMLIREIIPDVPVTFGGPWPSVNPEEAITNFGANFVVLGEGEKVFPELIDAIIQGLPTESIPGTACMINGHVKVNHGQYLTEDELNSLPLPAWELLDHNLYAKTNSMSNVGHRSYMTIVTSRGCPFKCAYCHQTMGKTFRKRTAESVLAEMEELYFQHGFKEFEILDDCFNLDRARMHTILNGIRERLGGAKLHFPNGLRSDMLEPGDMALFKEAGTVSVCFAIETASHRLQKMIHKNLDIDRAAIAINAAVKAGIYSSGFFMIGFPTESYNEALTTVEFAASSALHRAYFFNCKPFAGTEIAEMLSDAQKIMIYDTDPQNSNYLNYAFNISAMSDHDLQRVFQRAYRRFYLNPKRILRLILHHPDLLSLPRYALVVLVKILQTRHRHT